MNRFNFNDFELLRSFKNLQRGEKVYSRKHGLGSVLSFYKDEIIVQFPNLRKRFSIEDEEIRKIPAEYLVEIPKKRMKVSVNDVSMSYAKFKKGIRLEKQKYITIKKAAEALGVSKKVLNNIIPKKNIKTRKFGASPMILRGDLLKLSKII